MTDKSMLLILREAAQVERNTLTKYHLRNSADDLQAAMLAFAALPSREHMQALNGCWARATRMLSQAGKSPPIGGAGGAGLKEGAQLAA